MMIDTLKKRIRQAMLDRNELEKDVLRVALGDLQTEEARAGELSDADAERILRKMVKSNRETQAALAGKPDKAGKVAVLEKELAILESLLPKTLSAEETEAALAPVREILCGAEKDGMATGLAMKHLKTAGAVVDGKLVAQVVAAMRAAHG